MLPWHSNLTDEKSPIYRQALTRSNIPFGPPCRWLIWYEGEIWATDLCRHGVCALLEVHDGVGNLNVDRSHHVFHVERTLQSLRHFSKSVCNTKASWVTISWLGSWLPSSHTYEWMNEFMKGEKPRWSLTLPQYSTWCIYGGNNTNVRPTYYSVYVYHLLK